jgi:hypothetical protein
MRAMSCCCAAAGAGLRRVPVCLLRLAGCCGRWPAGDRGAGRDAGECSPEVLRPADAV